MIQSPANYSKYKEKIQNGETKSVAERLTVTPDREFKVMFESVTGKTLPDNVSTRTPHIEEIISVLSR